MSIRYPLLTQLLAVAGAFVVTATFAFSQGTANAINFAVAIAITLVALATSLTAPRGLSYRSLGVAAAVVGAFTILVTLGIFSGDAQRWVVFGGGAAVASAGLASHLLYLGSLRRRSADAAPAVQEQPHVAVASSKAA